MKLSENSNWKLLIWIPDQVENDQAGDNRFELCLNLYFSLSLSGLTRQSTKFRTPQEIAGNRLAIDNQYLISPITKIKIHKDANYMFLTAVISSSVVNGFSKNRQPALFTNSGLLLVKESVVIKITLDERPGTVRQNMVVKLKSIDSRRSESSRKQMSNQCFS